MWIPRYRHIWWITQLSLWSWTLLEKAPVAQLLRNFQHFMETEGSLPCSQEPATSPSPDPNQSSPYHHILFIPRLNLILSTHLYLGLPSVIFPSSFPTSILCAFILPHSCYMFCPSHLPWLHSNYNGEEYKLRSSSIWRFLQLPVTSSLYGPYILSALFPNAHPAFLP
jgi:hypothetical protein